MVEGWNIKGALPIGSKFGHYEVLSPVIWEGEAISHKCRCSCGKVQNVQTQRLLKGSAKGCIYCVAADRREAERQAAIMAGSFAGIRDHAHGWQLDASLVEVLKGRVFKSPNEAALAADKVMKICGYETGFNFPETEFD